jgi:hypothetical protein
MYTFIPEEKGIKVFFVIKLSVVWDILCLMLLLAEKFEN